MIPCFPLESALAAGTADPFPNPTLRSVATQGGGKEIINLRRPTGDPICVIPLRQ